MSENIVPLEQLGMNDVHQLAARTPRSGNDQESRRPRRSRARVVSPPRPPHWVPMEAGIRERIHVRPSDQLDTNDGALAAAGQEIRGWIIDSPLPDDLQRDITRAYGAGARQQAATVAAVRSSATAEDLPDASFAGQQETYLTTRCCTQSGWCSPRCSMIAPSLTGFTNVNDADVSLSAGIQRMGASDLTASGVMFSIDTESGFEDVVFNRPVVTNGETVVQGAVNWMNSTCTRNPDSILMKNRGSKMIKMVYADADDAPKNAIQTVEVDAANAPAFLYRRHRYHRAGTHGRYGSRCMMVARWISSGPRMVEAASVHCAGSTP